jgi:Lipoprotein signal peptidase
VRFALAALVVVTGAALDLATKAWARASLEPYGPAIDFLPFVSLHLTFNEGVSFSLFAFKGDMGQAALILVPGLLTLTMAIWAYRSQGWHRAALSLVVAGALAARASYPRSRPSVVGAQSPIFVLSDRSALVTAKAVEVDGQMVILSGSEAKQTEMASLASNIRGYRRRLIETGKLGVSGKQGVLVFKEDVSFTSPSAAAQAVMGSSRNGRTDWVTEEEGTTYASWQEEQLAKAVQSMTSPED